MGRAASLRVARAANYLLDAREISEGRPYADFTVGQDLLRVRLRVQAAAARCVQRRSG